MAESADDVNACEYRGMRECAQQNGRTLEDGPNVIRTGEGAIVRPA